MNDLFGMKLYVAEGAPEDRIFFVPQREHGESEADWMRRCAVLKMEPTRITMPATTTDTFEIAG